MNVTRASLRLVRVNVNKGVESWNQQKIKQKMDEDDEYSMAVDVGGVDDDDDDDGGGGDDERRNDGDDVDARSHLSSSQRSARAYKAALRARNSAQRQAVPAHGSLESDFEAHVKSSFDNFAETGLHPSYHAEAQQLIADDVDKKLGFRLGDDPVRLMRVFVVR